MVSDSILNASIALASSNHGDFVRRRRANRSAKLKQCKLDARREQWLSQVKNKGGCKEEVNPGPEVAGGSLMQLENLRRQPVEMKPAGGEEMYGNDSSHHFSYCDSYSSNSPPSFSSSPLGNMDPGINFTPSSRGSTSSRSNGCFSGSMSEEYDEDVDDNDCLEDWETVADALAATDSDHKEHSTITGCGSLSYHKHVNTAPSSSQLDTSTHPFSGEDISNAKPKYGGIALQKIPTNCRAWRLDDTCRPQSLPSLSKQYSLPLNLQQHLGQGAIAWGSENVVQVATSCPICYEDLDCTDSSFLPCSCGFMLCLFCHKRILEEDERCPGCRKQYNCDPVERSATLDRGSLTFQFSRSCSMITRSRRSPDS